jgi:hypothetical protein
MVSKDLQYAWGDMKKVLAIVWVPPTSVHAIKVSRQSSYIARGKSEEPSSHQLADVSSRPSRREHSKSRKTLCGVDS